jgi:hypothetical protein
LGAGINQVTRSGDVFDEFNGKGKLERFEVKSGK